MKGAVRRIVSCMNVGEEECKEVSLRKCKYVKTRENEKNTNCRRRKCCNMIKKGKFTKCMGCQFEKEECDEVKFEKCSFEITKPTCHRKKMLFTCKIRW